MRKRYWLRGGVIGFVISLLPSLVIIFYNCNVLSFFSDYPGEGSFCSWLYHARVPFVPFLPSTQIIIPILFILASVGSVIGININSFFPIHALLVIIYFGIDFFILGSLLSWIYGKLKSKKS